MPNKNKIIAFILVAIMFIAVVDVFAFRENKEQKREEELQQLQKRFEWWPTDAMPGPVKDAERGGYWWWPKVPGKIAPWGNRGYIYLYKIIFDYKEEELPPAKPQELRPSLLIKKIIKNVKIYFDYDKSDLRDDAKGILASAVKTLERNPQADILVTGNCDVRGGENYNEKLGRKRSESIKKFMIDNGISEKRVRIISRGKLDAVAPITDLVGMQKDRNAQFMIAEVEEIMMPAAGVSEVSNAKLVEEGKYVVEEEKTVASDVKVSTKEYIVQKGDSIWSIAEKEYGGGHRWNYLYEFNKDKIKNPNKLRPGQKILIPIE